MVDGLPGLGPIATNTSCIRISAVSLFLISTFSLTFWDVNTLPAERLVVNIILWLPLWREMLYSSQKASAPADIRVYGNWQ